MTEPFLAEELRLALAMRGGVSLSVWIGGAVREIERFRSDVILGSADPHHRPKSALAAAAYASGYRRVEIDVVSGASAGGLNAVILGAAMTNGKSLDMLRNVWLNAAAIEKLVRKSSGKTQPSILRGEYFLEQLDENMSELMKSTDQEAELIVRRLDVLLSVTSVVSNSLRAGLDPNAPVTEQRMDGQIHLRRRGSLLNEFSAEHSHDLACAARSTAAFPVAFNPLPIAPNQLLGDVDFRPARPEPLLLFDGGVSDNMPVGKAARAIGSAPADGPTDRLLLYLHPSPGAPDAASAKKALEARRALAKDGARPWDVLRTTLKSLRTKSLLEDLEAIEAHNADIERRLTDSDRILEVLRPSNGAQFLTLGAHGVVAPELDAHRLVDMFAAPWDHVSEHIPPREIAPKVGSRNGEQLEELTRVLTEELRPVTLPHADELPVLARNSLRPWGALIRMASLLIEWCQCAEEDAAIVGEVGERKALLYKLREEAVRTAAVLNVDTLDEFNTLSTNDAVAAATIVQVRRPLVIRQLPFVVEQWNEIAKIAAELRTLLPDSSTPPVAAEPCVTSEEWVSVFEEDRIGGVRVTHRHLEHHVTVRVPAVASSTDDDHEPEPAGKELRRAYERLMPRTPTVDQAKVALNQIDVALLPMHRGEPTGSLDRIRYLTISGNAGTPLAECFAWPDTLPKPEPHFTTVRPLPRGATPEGTLEFDYLRSDASSKLAGNQLHNFSAFLERSWRANDWMWGQMDAAATVVDLVLDPKRLAKMSKARRGKLADELYAICTESLRVGNGVNRWSRAITDASRREWEHARDAVRHELLEVETTSEVPPLTRTLLLWRRHLEIVAVEFDHQPGDLPIDGRTPETLSEAMGQWDDTSRVLDDKWGEKRTTALGMRAVFVGWRALFQRVKYPLAFIRLLLAPVIAPIAGFALCRRRTSFAFAIFLGGCVVPRVRDSYGGRVLVGLLAVAFAAGWLWITRHTYVDDQGRRRHELDIFKEFWSWATIIATAAVLVELFLVNESWFRNMWPTPERAHRGVLPYILPVSAVAIVTFVTWYWAKLRWRLAVTVMDGAIVAGWVWLGANAAAGRFGHGWGSVLEPIGSFWWALVAMILATTLLGYNIDVAALPDPEKSE